MKKLLEISSCLHCSYLMWKINRFPYCLKKRNNFTQEEIKFDVFPKWCPLPSVVKKRR